MLVSSTARGRRFKGEAKEGNLELEQSSKMGLGLEQKEKHEQLDLKEHGIRGFCGAHKRIHGFGESNDFEIT